MARLALDDAAWTGPWRHRSTAEKVTLAGALLVAALLSSGVAASLLVLGVAALVALAWARVPWRTYLLAFGGPLAFVAVGAVTLAVSVGRATPDALWSWGWLSTSGAALTRSAEVSARSLAATSALLLLAMTTPVHDLLGSLRRLRVPLPLLEIAALVYRLVFLTLDSALAVREAQAARLGYTNGRVARRSFGGLAAATFLRSWERARRMEAGLSGRGGASAMVLVADERRPSVLFLTQAGALLVTLAVAMVVLR